MVRQTHRFDSESGGDVLIFYADQVVAVIFFAAEGEVRGTAPNASCGEIEIRDHEFVMDSVAGQRGLNAAASYSRLHVVGFFRETGARLHV